MFYRSGQVANTSDGQSRTVVLSDIQTPEDRRLWSACIAWRLMMSLGRQYHWADDITGQTYQRLISKDGSRQLCCDQKKTSSGTTETMAAR
jgi:hypothetical protein